MYTWQHVTLAYMTVLLHTTHVFNGYTIVNEQ